MPTDPLDSELVHTTPRPHPRRLESAAYPVRTITQARYADMDVNSHLNNLALESMHENIRAVLNNSVFPEIYNPAIRGVRIVTSQNVVHFVAESHWPADIEACAGVGRIGRTSYVVSSGLFVDQRCVSTCDTVLVLLGDDGPVAIDDARRQALMDKALIS